jgi:hypothetical protein
MGKVRTNGVVRQKRTCGDVICGPSKDLNCIEVIFVEIVLGVKLHGQVMDAFWDEGDLWWWVWLFDELSRHEYSGDGMSQLYILVVR